MWAARRLGNVLGYPYSQNQPSFAGKPRNAQQKVLSTPPHTGTKDVGITINGRLFDPVAQILVRFARPTVSVAAAAVTKASDVEQQPDSMMPPLVDQRGKAIPAQPELCGHTSLGGATIRTLG